MALPKREERSLEEELRMALLVRMDSYQKACLESHALLEASEVERGAWEKIRREAEAGCSLILHPEELNMLSVGALKREEAFLERVQKKLFKLEGKIHKRRGAEKQARQEYWSALEAYQKTCESLDHEWNKMTQRASDSRWGIQEAVSPSLFSDGAVLNARSVKEIRGHIRALKSASAKFNKILSSLKSRSQD